MPVGLPLYVDERGEGLPVLALHGQPGLGGDFDMVARALSLDHRVLALDRPGYGKTGGEPLSMIESADLFASLLEEREASPATVIGHSYGAGIAALMAARHPAQVSGLVLVAPVGVTRALGGMDRLLAMRGIGEVTAPLALAAFGRLLPRLRRKACYVGGLTGQWLLASLPDERYKEVASSPGRRVWRTFLAEQRSLLAETCLIERCLPSIGVPSLVLTGSWDLVVSPRAAAAVASLISGARLVELPGRGHLLPRDDPESIAKAVREVESEAQARRARRVP